MRVLILSSGNSGSVTSFVSEQSLALQKKGIDVDFFLIKGKGYKGYIANLSSLKSKIYSFKPDLIHAHYGLTALLANLQRKVPVISTFHGSDIWVFWKNRLLSQIAHTLSKHSIIVNAGMAGHLLFLKKLTVIPCGVDIDSFYTVEKQIAQKEMKFPDDKINILFSSKFDYYEKNYPLAEKVLKKLGDRFNLVELKDYSRTQVNLLLNGCDIALMTSVSEGSPQFIKEAMACNCPIVSTDVGDVREVIGHTDGCYISTFDPDDIAEKILLALKYSQSKGRTNGREQIIKLGLDSETIADRIIEVYKKALKNTD
jgi:glycosyltransferase involved in cell wall biosynthesis